MFKRLTLYPGSAFKAHPIRVSSQKASMPSVFKYEDTVSYLLQFLSLKEIIALKRSCSMLNRHIIKLCDTWKNAVHRLNRTLKRDPIPLDDQHQLIWLLNHRSPLQGQGHFTPTPIFNRSKLYLVLNPFEETQLRCTIQQLINRSYSDPKEALFRHIIQNNVLELSHLLLKVPLLILSETRLGNTFLHLAAGNRHTAVITYLVKHTGADINATSHDGATPLHVAALQGDLPATKLLVHANAAITANNDGETPLHLAAAYGSLPLVKFLSKHASITDKDRHGHTPLQWASWNGHMPSANYLAEQLSQPSFCRFM